MLREEEKEDKDRHSGIARKRYLRSVSWTDRSPTKPSTSSSNPRPPPPPNRAARSFLPPLSITKRNAEEWPRAGSDDLGVWPNPQTPRGGDISGPPAVEFQFKRDKLAFFDKECSRIADHIYLGSDAVAKNRDVLRQNGITHVLNCVGFVCPEYFKVDLIYKTLWLQDTPSEDITSVLYDVFDYFEDVREQGGRVFVHCCQGVSRSSSLVIAYLMWREGRSFEDAFHCVRAARGVTNPNAGFAGQLVQAQKRVHAAPASPCSAPRVYRMAPHSPYDPLHLVPKTVGGDGAGSLDSRGAFVVVHSVSGLYVWSGRDCGDVMSGNARAAAFQVIRYERAKGPVVSVAEGEEPPEFWEALAAEAEAGFSGGRRKVEEYDVDFELFRKALAGGVVPPFSASGAASETCLPARENGWSRLRRKFSDGIVRGFVSSTRLNSGDDVSPETHLCGSPDSFECFPSPGRSPMVGGSKSPTLSPSTSDYASSFSFSPSSSNWSDLSSRQPSPSGFDSADPYPIKKMSLLDGPNLLGKDGTVPASPEEEGFYGADRDRYHDPTAQAAGVVPRSIAERRGSNPPPRVLLTSADDGLRRVARNLGRSWSFSVGYADDDDDDYEMEGSDRSEYEDPREGVSETKIGSETLMPVLYQLPYLNKIEGFRVRELDSRSSYVLMPRESGFGRKSPRGGALTFWLGREASCGDASKSSEAIARDFLNRADFPLDTPFQIVREGEEPVQFLSQLRCLALQEGTGNG